MIQVTKSTPIPTVEQVISILTFHNRKMGIPLDYDRICEYHALFGVKAMRLKQVIAKYINFNGIDGGNLTDDIIKKWLTKNGWTEGFLLTKGKALSLNAESINAALALDKLPKEVNEILKLKLKESEYTSAINLFWGILQNFPVSPIESWDNHRIVFVRPEWTPQNTGRIGASNPAVMNVGRMVNDIFTVPKGWRKKSVDSGQVDPRISQSIFICDPILTACTMAYNDAYYGYLHYCTILTDQQRLCGDPSVVKPIPVSDLMLNKRKKFKTFGNAVMYGSESNIENDSDKGAFIKYIGRHPQRVKHVKEYESDILNGMHYVKTYFGTELDIYASDKLASLTPGTDKYYHQLLKNCINYKIQGTAADLMRLSCYKAHQYLTKEAPDSVISQYVHDAGKFIIHEDEWDKVSPVLDEITAYQVDDWIPIYGDVENDWHNSSGIPRLV